MSVVALTAARHDFYDDVNGARRRGELLNRRLSAAWAAVCGAMILGGCSSSPSVAVDSGAGNGSDALPTVDSRRDAGDAGDLRDDDVGVTDAQNGADSSPGDTGPLDDAGADDAATSCRWLFCEDFETGTLDPLIWSVETGGGQTVSIEDTMVAHGKHALHFHVPADVGTYGFIITKNPPAALRSHYFGRARFHATPSLPFGNQQLLIAGNGVFPDFSHFFVATGAIGWMQKVVLAGSVVAESETWLHGRIPEGRWTCLEWEMTDVPGHASFFVDGSLIDSYNVTPVGQGNPFGGFAQFGFGYYASPPNNGPIVPYAIDLYYDDIVLHTERIGCL